MSKKSTVHYNEDVKNTTINMFLNGASPSEIEKAIRNLVREYKKRGNK